MGKYSKRLTCLAAGLLGLLPLSGCSAEPASAKEKDATERDADVALAKAKKSDPSLSRVIDAAAGYALFPAIAKGAVGVGGAYGRGVLYERGVAVGYCDLSQASIGLQLGAQTYMEIIAFETPKAVEAFKQGTLSFDAQATAVALKSGVGANAKYTNDVAVFTMDEAGLMYEASIGGQKFRYHGK